MSVSWSGLCDLCSRICRRALVMVGALAFLRRRRRKSLTVFYRCRCRHFVGTRAVYKLSKPPSGMSN